MLRCARNDDRTDACRRYNSRCANPPVHGRL